MTRQLKISASILSADFSCLQDELKAVSTADWIHLDIMDGHFVPNISFGSGVVNALRPYTKQFFDVHLMIENPDNYIDDFAKAGADGITVHVESCIDIIKTINKIHNLGIKAGIALKPSTPILNIKHIIKNIDMVLVMTVNPGFSGQKFNKNMLHKIKNIVSLIDNESIDIAVDGGINRETASLCINVGANVLVSGSTIFKGENKDMYINNIRELKWQKNHI